MQNSEINDRLSDDLDHFGLPPLPDEVVDSHKLPMDLSGEIWRFNDPSHISSFNFAKRGIEGLSPGQLRIGHDAKVLGAGQRRDSCIARVARNDASEARPGHKLHQLGEKRLAKIHEESPKKSIWGNYSQKRLRNSNRHQIKRAANPRRYWLLAEYAPRSPDTTGN